MSKAPLYKCLKCGQDFVRETGLQYHQENVDCSPPDPPDPVNHPPHYTSHPSGVECIQITEHFNFCIGNAIKYLWRAGEKSPNPVEDLRKAAWYINREIERLSRD